MNRTAMNPIKRRICFLLSLAAASWAAGTWIASPAGAQVTTSRILSASPDRTANLEEQLTNRLRAVADDQRGFVRYIVNLVKQGKLDARFVIAVERYAIRRNPTLPFPFFERAIRFEADKRGITVPPVRRFADSRQPG